MPGLASIALQVFAKYYFQNSSDISPLKYLNSRGKLNSNYSESYVQ